MRSGFSRLILVPQLAILLVTAVLLSDCWIPLPEETAIVVEVLDARGNPVDGVSLLLDSSETIVTGSQLDAGQVFKSLSEGGDHTIQIDTASLLDPQGGIQSVPLAYQKSGDLSAIAFSNRPFVGSSDVLIVPVNDGEITVLTVFLDDILKSPVDNQWLTDGTYTTPSPYRIGDNTDEYRDNPEPVFWWRQEPSLGDTVIYTFQLWEDYDEDTRFPLGVIDHVQYAAAMDPLDPDYIQPDWQVPLAGVQRAKAASLANQVFLWSSQVTESPVKYDLYYAPSSQWNSSDWERNAVLRDIAPDGSLDGSAVRFRVGIGTPNSSVVFKNGLPYTFAIRARDTSSNLDTTMSTTAYGQRTAVPPASATLGGISNFSVVGTSGGGTLDLSFDCDTGDSLRIYSAPSSSFNFRPMDVRFIRDEITCTSPTTSYSLVNLVNGLPYSVAVEPFDASGNVGASSSILTAVPAANLADTDDPVFLGTPLVVDRAGLGPGQVRLTVAAAADSTSTPIRRVSWSPATLTNDPEAMSFTDLGATPVTALVLSDIPNRVPYNFAVRAIDGFGNVSSDFSNQVELTEPDATGPMWVTDDPGFYATISYSTASTTRPLGATWGYGSAAGGFLLGRAPAQGQGEYVWRIVQENPVKGLESVTKLGAFYTYSGYYYASTESGSLDMSKAGPGRPGGGPTANADHRDVFSFIEGASNVLSGDVMGTPFDSTDSAGYRQRTADLFSASLAAGSGTVNQLTILYNTDEDGQAVVSEIATPSPGFAGILRVFSSRKQPPLPTPEPHLQVKEFQISYYDVSDGLVNFPPPTFGGSGIFFLGTLDDPDYQDPLW